jgi:hypothetical protein
MAAGRFYAAAPPFYRPAGRQISCHTIEQNHADSVAAAAAAAAHCARKSAVRVDRPAETWMQVPLPGSRARPHGHVRASGEVQEEPRSPLFYDHGAFDYP